MIKFILPYKYNLILLAPDTSGAFYEFILEISHLSVQDIKKTAFLDGF
ncbi:MAG TPA: hypothetical protein VF676_11880 [Flavobacterium sp.]|jgi:hypothetical protein